MDGAIHKISIKEQTKTRMQEHGEKSGSRKDKKAPMLVPFQLFSHLLMRKVFSFKLRCRGKYKQQNKCE
ncbi:hypothetical protein BJD94_20575 [Vibrio vulnificus Env1]|nr:hypothetical protein AOT11_06385 [Vibrio vulnificus NBRC 15645 = ATCC 27562]AVX02242.1 hypothetical protein BJD94_20575 [Vibrio vulnificus Env1]KHF89015.1 hypothetical protein OA15_00400 [Vibrio vulnificus]KHF90988.1 hypothetical protein OA19_02150 [Vibrio vulnificus]KHF92487.1 hypothetical protein OA16_04180 [Vibrio vulnificus]